MDSFTVCPQIGLLRGEPSLFLTPQKNYFFLKKLCLHKSHNVILHVLYVLIKSKQTCYA